MSVKKILAILCIFGLMLPFAAGCGGKKDGEKKADEQVTSGDAQSNKMRIAGPAKKMGAKKGTSKYNKATFAQKGRPQEEGDAKIMTKVKKEGDTEDAEGEEEKTE